MSKNNKQEVCCESSNCKCCDENQVANFLRYIANYFDKQD